MPPKNVLQSIIKILSKIFAFAVIGIAVYSFSFLMILYFFKFLFFVQQYQ